MKITITFPQSGTPVGWTFPVNGTYDLSNTMLPENAPPGSIAVLVFESDGVTPLGSTMINPPVAPLPPGQMSGPFPPISVTHNANYDGAIITATLAVPGGGSTGTRVEDIQIVQSPPPPPPARG